MFNWWVPPMVSAGAHRPLSQLRFAGRAGWRGHVIAGPAPDEPTLAGLELERAFPNVFQVVRVKPDDLFVGGRGFPNTHENGVLRGVAMARASYRLATSPAVVIASGPPFATFIAGKLAARRFGAPLVLDYRDAWSQCGLGIHSRGRRTAAWERYILRSASAAIFTTAALRDATLAALGVRPARVALIPNGWEVSDIAAVPELDPEPGVLAYVGHMGNHPRLPDFLDACAQVLARRPDLRQRITIRFVGLASNKQQQIFRNHVIADRVEYVPFVPKSEALAQMRSAAALFIVGDETLSMYIPGKLYDYLAMRRPVLFYGADGEAPAIIRRSGAGWYVPFGDHDHLEQALDCIAKAASPRPQANHESWLAEHTRDHLANRFFDIVDDVVSSGDAAPTRGRTHRQTQTDLAAGRFPTRAT